MQKLSESPNLARIVKEYLEERGYAIEIREPRLPSHVQKLGSFLLVHDLETRIAVYFNNDEVRVCHVYSDTSAMPNRLIAVIDYCDPELFEKIESSLEESKCKNK